MGTAPAGDSRRRAAPWGEGEGRGTEEAPRGAAVGFGVLSRLLFAVCTRGQDGTRHRSKVPDKGARGAEAWGARRQARRSHTDRERVNKEVLISQKKKKNQSIYTSFKRGGRREREQKTVKKKRGTGLLKHREKCCSTSAV